MPANKIELTEEQQIHIVKLASYRVPHQVIGSVCGISRSTLERNYRAQLDEGKDQSEIGYRRVLHELAMDGNIKALTIALKWHCGYKEPPREVHATIDPAQLLADIKAADAATIIPPPEAEE